MSASASVTQFELTGKSGTRLVGDVWPTSGAARAVVVYAHGYGEHSWRNTFLFDALAAAGFAVVSIDHMGHGKSEGDRAFVRNIDVLVEDFHQVVERAATLYPGLPIFSFGHSMGGLIVIRHALVHQVRLAGMIASAPALVVGEDVPALRRGLMRIVARIKPRLVLGRGEPGRLSSDPAIELAMTEDPLCHQEGIKLATAVAIFNGGRDALSRAGGLTLPIYLFHGADDEVCWPRGSEALFSRASSEDKALKIWPGMRHECFNEPESELVIDGFISWLTAHLPKAAVTR